MTKASDRKEIVRKIQAAVDSGVKLVTACNNAGISRRTYDRWNKDDNWVDGRTTCKRPTPKNKLRDEEKEKILEIVNKPEYSSLPVRSIVADLLDKKQYLGSASTFYTVLKEDKQLKHRGKCKKPEPRPISTHCAKKPNDVWVADITYIPSYYRGQFFYHFSIMDLYSRFVVDHEVWDNQDAINLVKVIQRSFLKHKICLNDHLLVLHTDNGPQMTSDIYKKTLNDLNIIDSKNRPRVSNDNAFMESHFKTLKYFIPIFQNKFENLEAARLNLNDSIHYYNYERKHGEIQHVTPYERFTYRDIQLLKERNEFMQEVIKEKPERWAKSPREWKYINEVWLNPPKGSDKQPTQNIYQSLALNEYRDSGELITPSKSIWLPEGI
ncbi:MAG: IS3 family transposase [Oscillospiraceae bacterium]|nr:IS3 family transposase [Oscillospiraceae bacterium]